MEAPKKKVVKKKEKKKDTAKEFRPKRQGREDPLLVFQEKMREMEEQEKKRAKERMESKIREEERQVDSLRLNIRRKYRNMVFETPPPYKPMEPVVKSSKLIEFEDSIHKGTFFDNERTKNILENVRNSTRKLKVMNAMSALSYDDFKSGSIGFGRL